MGAAKGLAITGSPVVSVITGMLTATFGGILRDLLAGEPSVLLRPEIYVTAALAGAAVFTLADLVGLANARFGVAGFAAAFLVRGGALRFRLDVSSAYRSRPGRGWPRRHPHDSSAIAIRRRSAGLPRHSS